MIKDPKDPSSTSHAYDAMLPTWGKINDALGGTERMRSAGEKRLPRHENERSDAYSQRLEGVTFFNATELTLDSWVGRPFSEPLLISDVEAPVAEYLKDVDLQGNNLAVFARNWFREGLAKSFAHVLVDNPMPENAENRTLADDRKENLRPYFCFVRPENLISASAVVIDGKEVLIEARIREEEFVKAGFTEVLIERIRVFSRVLPREGLEEEETGVFFQLWQLFEAEKGSEEDEWRPVTPETKLGIDRIPLVTFYSNRQSLMFGKSPLEDLVDLNIRHWQSSSDQTNVLTVARFPMLALSGGSEDESVIEIGPKRMLFSPDPQAKFYYVEHTGAAIEAGRNDILDIEEQMAHYGAQFTRRRPAIESATARILNSSESTSSLRNAAIRFNDSLQNVVDLMGEWIDVEIKGTVRVLVDFSAEEAQTADLQTLDNARGRADLSREAYLKEIQRHGVIADDFDFKKNEKGIEKEKAAEPAPLPVSVPAQKPEP